MAQRKGAVHVSTTRRHYKGKAYETMLLRRSYREGGKVKNETVGNLSHLPAHVIDAIRAMLAGRLLVDVDEQLAIERSLPHGHVAAVLGVLRDLDLERLISRERCRERDLVVAMVVPAADRPGLEALGDAALRADDARRRALARRGLGGRAARGDGLAARAPGADRAGARPPPPGRRGVRALRPLLELRRGRCCPLAALGYSRDGKRGTAQINYGLTCSPEGRPVAIAVHDGSTHDQQTLPGAVAAVRERFGISDVVVVGDRGMLTEPTPRR